MQRDPEAQRPGADVPERQSSHDQGAGLQQPAGIPRRRGNLETYEVLAGSVADVNQPSEGGIAMKRPALPPTRGVLLP